MNPAPCVLVTGAARRIGAAIARGLHARGARVMIHYCHAAEPAHALVAELNAVRPDSADWHAADLRDTAQLEALAETAWSRWGRLDGVVHNASTFYPTAVGATTLAQWDDLMGTNLRAPYFLTQALAPALRASGGSVVNLVDIHAIQPLKDHPVYCAAKAGLVMLTRSLARELAPEVRVNAVAPGAILWPERPMSTEVRERIVERIALKRSGMPEDIARTVAFLLLDAPYITGQVLAVDGGRSLGY
ncbi:MAG TPA: pteridine reductase [Candidatus Macondimonas sp.]|nr:pteridine reductase [Candidatus Macondimonas sp.]